MAVVNEQTVSGRKFRKLIDEANRLWLRISFWTMACDVEFDDGETAETKFENIANTINNLKQSFQDGVNKIFNFLKGLGFTPSPNSPDGICNAIQNMYNKRYSDGRLHGQNDVKENPSDYGISTGISQDQFVLRMSREDFAVASDTYTIPHDGTCYLKFDAYASYSKSHNANTLILSATKNGNDSPIIYETFDKNVTNGGVFNWNNTIEIPSCTKGETITLQFNHQGADLSWIAGIY